MSTSDTPKWKVTENVVAAIERSLNAVQGARVIPNASIRERVSGVYRQVDVYVEIPTGPRVLRVGVEVRDKSAPLDLTEVEQLIAKLKKLDIDYGCVVSRAGFTVTAKEEADRNGIELLHFQVNFRPEKLAHVTLLLAGAAGTDLELTLTNGETGT